MSLSSTSMTYYTLTGGDNLETIKTKMFANINDSTIKGTIDSWYSTNLTDYTSYLENTIFCNDRTFFSGNLSSKDANSTSGLSYFQSHQRYRETYSPSLQCTNQNDRFSLKVGSGGMVGYGNNALTYPVGLLTLDEVMLAGGVFNTNNTNYYLYTGEDYWFLSPTSSAPSYIGALRASGALSQYNSTAFDDKVWVRPVVSLVSETKIIQGMGTTSDPYIITE